MRFIGQHMRFEFFNEGQNVITYGERGDKFYVLLHGKLEVYIPLLKNKRVSKIEFTSKL